MRGAKIALAAAAATLALSAGARAPMAQPGACFRSSDWRGWKATRDGSGLYIDTGLRRVFRLELADPCPELKDFEAKLLTISSGSEWICHPKDLDLRVWTPATGVAAMCRVRRMSRLYPSEVQSLPRELRP